MVTNEIVLTPAGAAMWVSTSAEDLVTCPHCAAGIMLEEIEPKPGCLAVVCPHCERESLLVRLVSVLHRVVRWPEKLLASRAARSAVQMPDAVFSVKVSRGASVLLLRLWREAEKSGTTTVTSSVTRLARGLMSSRSVVRGWLDELEQAGTVRELPRQEGRAPRQWELLPLVEMEGDDAGR